MLSNSHPDYFITSGKAKIFYNKNFSDTKALNNHPVLLFNYGLVCNNAHWEKQISHFENMYPIIIHNYRGHFNSSSLDGVCDCTLKNITQDTHELLDHLGVDNVVAFGHSMGVNVTLELALKRKLRGMVLISGSILPPQEVMFDSNVVELVTPYWQLFSQKFPKLYQKIWKTSFLNPVVNKLIHKGGFNTKKVPKEFVQLYLKRIGELDPNIFLQLLNDMQNHDIIGRIDKIKSRALIMGGDKDHIIPNYLQHTLLEYLPNAELYIIKDGSHVPQVDFPESVNERISLFLESL